MSTFRGKEAALGKEGEQEVEEIMWVPPLILFLTQSLLWVLSSHIVSHLVLQTCPHIVYVYEQLWRCPPLIPAPILFLAQSLWDGGKFKERFVAYGLWTVTCFKLILQVEIFFKIF